MRRAAALVAAAGLLLAGCGDRQGSEHTSVLGGRHDEAAAQPPPPPPVPAGTQAQVLRPGGAGALAVWVQDGHVVASTFTPPGGWSEPRALEDIYGEASDPQLAGNGQGSAMAVWRHTVGSIRSLRFSRFEPASGWSAPDVVPGALPQPHKEGAVPDADAPRLAMDAQGRVTARWPSGFAAGETQVARYTPGEGWSRPASEPVAAAAPEPAPAAATQ